MSPGWSQRFSVTEARKEPCVQGLGLVASTVSTPLLSLPLQCHLQRATTWPPFSSFEGLEGELESSRTGGSEGDPSGLQNCRQGWRMLRAGGGDTEGAATLGGGGKGSLLHRDSVQAAPGPLQLEDQSDHLTSEAWDFQIPGPPEENRRASRSHLRKTARGPESANHHQLWDETVHPFPPHNLPGARRIPCQPLHAAARCPAPRCSGDRARGLSV